MSKGYACVKPTDAGAATIVKALRSVEWPSTSNVISPGDLHVTLMYDKTDPDIDPAPTNEMYEARVTGVKILGTAVVIELGCDALYQRHFALREMGYKTDYPDFTAHMSVVYDKSPEGLEDALPQVQSLFDRNLLSKVIYLTDETWNSVKD